MKSRGQILEERKRENESEQRIHGILDIDYATPWRFIAILASVLVALGIVAAAATWWLWDRLTYF